MPAAAVIAAAVPLIQQGASMIDTTNNKDPERFARAQAWYSAAIAGDAVALCHLKYMGGLRGNAPGGCAGVAAGGFATNVAKAYCESLYQQALRVLAGQQSPAMPIPPAPGASGAGQTVGQVAQGVSQVSTAVATGLGYTPQPTPTQLLSAATSWAPVILIGVVGLVVYLAVRSR